VTVKVGSLSSTFRLRALMGTSSSDPDSSSSSSLSPAQQSYLKSQSVQLILILKRCARTWAGRDAMLRENSNGRRLLQMVLSSETRAGIRTAVVREGVICEASSKCWSPSSSGVVGVLTRRRPPPLPGAAAAADRPLAARAAGSAAAAAASATWAWPLSTADACLFKSAAFSLRASARARFSASFRACRHAF